MSAAESILAQATQLTGLVEQLVLMSSLLQGEHSRTPYELTFRKNDDMAWFCHLPIGHLSSNEALTLMQVVARTVRPPCGFVSGMWGKPIHGQFRRYRSNRYPLPRRRGQSRDDNVATVLRSYTVYKAISAMMQPQLRLIIISRAASPISRYATSYPRS